jgi:diguanylate cyclase (GGDEF)-like protein
VFVDLDRFKLINDTLGHPAGDAAIRAFARALHDAVRRSDLAGRMGGDEFAACLVEANKTSAARVLARLEDAVGELTRLGDLPEPFTFSAGCAQFPAEARDVDTLFSVADERLYASKRAKAA